ncbi:MAG: flagellar biosynthesis protein FliQ [Spirochaetales bacterium]|nr:flagellar biosynthesis protein FliQ [Spirochaetales bacterium]RKX86771.1 MAG: flagellar biosynthetic protein FliQ [Spirochaetota bacterium]
MSIGFAVNLMRGGVLQTLMIAAPILLIGMLVGLIVSILQATTSIQEQTLTFVPKIAAILGAIFVFGPWIVTSMVQFTKRLLEQIPNMTG